MGVEAWVQAEFSSLDFGDERLNKRLMGVAESLSDQPESSLYRAMESWGEAKAAYRLFDNEKVTPEKILAPHIDNSLKRCAEYPKVLAIQDTSYAVYNKRDKTEGLGVLSVSAGKTAVRGLKVHTTLAVTTDGIPLGVIDQKIWARSQFRKSNQDYQGIPVEEKESIKWLEAGHQTKFQEPTSTRFIVVADREADVYEAYREFQTLGLDFLIRVAKNNRNINKQYHRREPVREKFQSFLESHKTLGVIDVEVRDQHQRMRVAALSVWAAPVTFPPPANRTETINGNDLVFVPLWGIYAKELKPPKGEPPIEWLLATSLPLKTAEDVLEKIKWYSFRWNIEVFHKVLKSGCGIEKSQLRHGERLKKYIALMSVIGWRLFWLGRVGRSHPDLPCSVILAPHEWQALSAWIKKTSRTSSKPPTLGQAILWIAKLGGFKARKSDGPPGITSLWRGWNELKNLAEYWLLFKKGKTCG
jgi:hypothetical protein